MTLSLAHCFAKEHPNYVPTQNMHLYFGATLLDEITGSFDFKIFGIQERTIKRVLTYETYSPPYGAYGDVSIIGIAFPA